MKFAKDKILIAQSMAASIESDPINLDQIYSYAFQAQWTGSPSGTLKLQGSCDIIQSGEVPTNWNDIPDSSQDVAAVTSKLYNYAQQSYHWIRVVFTRTGGSGALSVTYNGKG